MLQGSFFKINSIETTESDINVVLEINALHKIFEGHFPGHPVVPGVCMMQMIKEIIEVVTQKKANILKANEMKFLAIIDPTINNIISATIKYTMEDNGNILVMSTLFYQELTHFKFKGLIELL